MGLTILPSSSPISIVSHHPITFSLDDNFCLANHRWLLKLLGRFCRAHSQQASGEGVAEHHSSENITCFRLFILQVTLQIVAFLCTTFLTLLTQHIRSSLLAGSIMPISTRLGHRILFPRTQLGQPYLRLPPALLSLAGF